MKLRLAVLIVVFGGMLIFVGAGGTGAGGPEQFGAHWVRLADKTRLEILRDGLASAVGDREASRLMGRHLQSGADPQAPLSTPQHAVPAVVREDPTAESNPAGATGFSAGSTFLDMPISKELSIDRLSRAWTQSKLGRELFRTPGATASFYTVHYMQGPPYVSARYVQFIVDPSWNRVVYGDMEGWIKAYGGLNNPTSIAVDPTGRVFIGEEGAQRVSVFRLEGNGNGTQLMPLFTLDGMKAPAAIALTDGGTPLDPSDDFLYVADAGAGTILKYALGDNGGALVATYSGFVNPSAVTVGRWDGVNNGFVYVVDNIAKRIRVLEDTGNSLDPIAVYTGDHASYFAALTVDHFGNVYAADNTNSRIVKFTSSLELLDEDRADDLYAALAAVEVPFGTITIDGKGTMWAGFDQLFAVERWSEKSGARRRMLGLAMKDIAFSADESAGTVTASFLLTDFGIVGGRVADAQGVTVRSISSAGMVSGRKEFVWDRKDDGGRLVPPGAYHYELHATDSYQGATITAAADWQLPLYYREVAGEDEPHLLRGSTIRWPGFSATQDAQVVQYRFTGLNPAASYRVSAVYAAPPDGLPRVQDMTAGDGIRIHDPMAVGMSGASIDFAPVPAAAYGSGVLVLSINRRDAGSAVVSQLILKETGTGFSSVPAGENRPTAYSLSQNYPNPFNPSTVIRYALPQDGYVSMIVYDVNGREVTRLVDGVTRAGAYEVRFDAGSLRPGGLASGVYFCRLNAGKFSQTKKMLLLK